MKSAVLGLEKHITFSVLSNHITMLMLAFTHSRFQQNERSSELKKTMLVLKGKLTGNITVMIDRNYECQYISIQQKSGQANIWGTNTLGCERPRKASQENVS